MTSYHEDDMKRRSSPTVPKDGPTNKSKWKCHAPLHCMPNLQKPAKSPNFLCKRLRRGFQVVLTEFGVLWVFVRVGQGYRDEPSLEVSEGSPVDAGDTA